MTFDTKRSISDNTQYMEMVCTTQGNKYEMNCDTTPYDTCTETEICNDMGIMSLKEIETCFIELV